MAEAILALGGNLGPVRDTFDRAVTLLCDGESVRLLARSSDYRTAPWGDPDQPSFVNACLIVATTLSPRALLARTQAIEAALGRNRAYERRWGPRPIDIDLITYDNLVIAEPDLVLPHPFVARTRIRAGAFGGNRPRPDHRRRRGGRRAGAPRPERGRAAPAALIPPGPTPGFQRGVQRGIPASGTVIK